jgi:hypothetical protein
MKTFVLILVIVVFLGSPLWTSALVALLPQRLVGLAFGICAIQGLLAYAVWWFFWGGGIGGEAHLSESWQSAFGFALLPLGVAAFRFWQRPRNAEQAGCTERRERVSVGNRTPFARRR